MHRMAPTTLVPDTNWSGFTTTRPCWSSTMMTSSSLGSQHNTCTTSPSCTAVSLLQIQNISDIFFVCSFTARFASFSLKFWSDKRVSSWHVAISHCLKWPSPKSWEHQTFGLLVFVDYVSNNVETKTKCKCMHMYNVIFAIQEKT